jgi:hypothetical protein
MKHIKQFKLNESVTRKVYVNITFEAIIEMDIDEDLEFAEIIPDLSIVCDHDSATILDSQVKDYNITDSK